MNAGELQRLLRPFAVRIRSLFGRAVVRLVAPSGDELQRLQVEVGREEVHDDVLHAQPYGLAAVPLPGSEAFMIWPGGERQAGVAVCVDDRRGRPSLESGEVALYHAPSGAMIKLRNDGRIQMVGDVVIEGSLSVSDEVSDGAGSLSDVRQVFDVHTHGTSTGPTTPPTPTFGGGA